MECSLIVFKRQCVWGSLCVKIVFLDGEIVSSGHKFSFQLLGKSKFAL